VNDVLPGFVPGLLGGFQVLLWLAILGLEIGGLVYHPWRGTAYAGFWCGAIFFDTWISMFCYREYFLINLKYISHFYSMS
jgi:hypothetical protein